MVHQHLMDSPISSGYDGVGFEELYCRKFPKADIRKTQFAMKIR